MLAGPEVARIINQFEEDYNYDGDPEEITQKCHHEEGPASRSTFQRHVNGLTTTIRNMGNPFQDDFPELVQLDTRDCVDNSIAISLSSFEELGMKQYKEYKKSVILESSKAIDETIKKNNFPLFKRRSIKKESKQAKQISSLQNNVSLFAQLCVAMQNCGCDLRDFFAHEVHPFPPSISEYGILRLPSAKSDLLKCLPMHADEASPPNLFDCKILEGAVIVHSLQPTGAITFEDYANDIFIPHILYHLQLSKRVDIVWDSFISGSLKECTREKRGSGVRRKVSSHVKIPSNWMAFLRDSTNKSELFQFLSYKISVFDFPPNKIVCITSGRWYRIIIKLIITNLNNILLQHTGQAVITRGSTQCMSNCNHEEADTRIIVHLQDAIANGEAGTALIRTVDTDVVVILIGKFFNLQRINQNVQVWVAFGMG